MAGRGASAASNQISQAPHTMNITHHLNTIIKNAIKNKVSSDRKVLDTDGDIVASRPHLRVARERFAYCIEIIEKPSAAEVLWRET
jgi:hypothetical protein